MAIQETHLKELIEKNLPGAQVTLTDLAGDGDHYAVHVIYSGFEGKSRIQQHQLVYQALDGVMGGNLHALSIKTSLS